MNAQTNVATSDMVNNLPQVVKQMNNRAAKPISKINRAVTPMSKINEATMPMSLNNGATVPMPRITEVPQHGA